MDDLQFLLHAAVIFLNRRVVDEQRCILVGEQTLERVTGKLHLYLDLAALCGLDFPFAVPDGNVEQHGLHRLNRQDVVRCFFVLILRGQPSFDITADFRVILILRQDLPDLQLCAIRNFRAVIIGYDHFILFTRIRNHVRMDLCIRHPDRKRVPVLHGDCQRLFARKRLQTDQCPVSGFDRLCVDLSDLFFCQFCAVFTFQSTAIFDLSNRCIFFNPADIYKFRAAEFDLLYIRKEFGRILRDLKCLYQVGKADESAAGNAELERLSVYFVVEVYREGKHRKAVGRKDSRLVVTDLDPKILDLRFDTGYRNIVRGNIRGILCGSHVFDHFLRKGKMEHINRIRTLRAHLFGKLCLLKGERDLDLIFVRMVFDFAAGRIPLLIQLVDHERDIIEDRVLFRIARIIERISRRICGLRVQSLHVGVVIVAVRVRCHRRHRKLGALRNFFGSLKYRGYIVISVLKLVKRFLFFHRVRIRIQFLICIRRFAAGQFLFRFVFCFFKLFDQIEFVFRVRIVERFVFVLFLIRTGIDHLFLDFLFLRIRQLISVIKKLLVFISVPYYFTECGIIELRFFDKLCRLIIERRGRHGSDRRHHHCRTQHQADQPFQKSFLLHRAPPHQGSFFFHIYSRNAYNSLHNI